MNNSIIADDLTHIWHPATQMHDFLTNPPLIVNKTRGAYLYTNQGKILDGISSWWCKSLGHSHPQIIKAIKKQLDQFSQTILANTTYENLAELGKKLYNISNNEHVFFANDGSSAVEIAMKLAIHAKQFTNQSQCNEFIALSNSYHGETLGALSVSDLPIYKSPYQTIINKCNFINNIPYTYGYNAPLNQDCANIWPTILTQLENIKHKCCAIIIEPLIQGAGGMYFYSADFLSRLGKWAKLNNIYIIADEIMTGIGRTGKWLACQHTNLQPNIICISKGLTAGFVPMSCVLIEKQLFNLFYDDYDKGKNFLHSHTYSGNALAVSAALATLNVITQDNLLQNAINIGQIMYDNLINIANITNKLTNVRSLGAIVAADLINWSGKRLGYTFQNIALQYGALLRPIGNTLYWLPPLNSTKSTIAKLAEITLKSINSLYMQHT